MLWAVLSFFLSLVLISSAHANENTPFWQTGQLEKASNKTAFLSQKILVNAPNDKTKHIPLVELFINFPETEKGVSSKPMLQIKTPLMTHLISGVGVRVDKGKGSIIPFQFCNHQACYANSMLNDEVIKAWQKGKSVFISFKLLQAPKPFMIEASLTGFTKALAETRQKVKRTAK